MFFSRTTLLFSKKRIYRLNYYFLIPKEYQQEIEIIHLFLSQILFTCSAQDKPQQSQSIDTVTRRPTVVSRSLCSPEKDKLSG